MSNYQDRIKPVDFGIQTYLGNIQAGSYQIPTFQRDVVWERGIRHVQRSRRVVRGHDNDDLGLSGHRQGSRGR